MRKGSWNVEIEFKFNIVQYNEFKKIIESILSVIFLLKNIIWMSEIIINTSGIFKHV